MNLRKSGKIWGTKKLCLDATCSILGTAREDAGTIENRGKDGRRWLPGDMEPLVEVEKNLAPSILPFS